MKPPTMKVEDLLELVRETANRFEDAKIYYALRGLKLHYIRQETVELLKAILALHQHGLPITTKITASLLGEKERNLINRLHSLGDKHVLVYKRTGERTYSWAISPFFLERLNGKGKGVELKGE